MIWHQTKRININQKFPWSTFNVTSCDDVTFRTPSSKSVTIIICRGFIIKFIQVMNKSQVILLIEKDFSFINAPTKCMVYVRNTPIIAHNVTSSQDVTLYLCISVCFGV